MFGALNARAWVAAASALAAATVLAASGGDPWTRLREAREAYESGDFVLSEARYRALTLDFPSQTTAAIGLGRAIARQGRTSEAVQLLERVAIWGAGADIEALRRAFGPAADQAGIAGLLARFRANGEPLVRSQVAFRLAERDLMPESVAFDAADGAFYVGSLRKRKIVVVRNGGARDFVENARDGLTAVLGMKVDGERRELLANACNLGASPAIEPPDAASTGTSVLFRYALPSGRLLGKHAAGSTAQPLCFNDLALDGEGNAYLTASSGDGPGTTPDALYKFTRSSQRLEKLVELPGVFVNGIAVSRDGRGLYVTDHLRGIIRVDVATLAVRVVEVPATATLAGIDGLYAVESGLVGVQNGLSEGPERVIQAFLDETATRATCVVVLERNHPDYDVPTTGAIVDGDLVYVAGSQLNRLDAQGRPWSTDRLRESSVLRLPLAKSCTESTRSAQRAGPR